ncbi:hypothetical protein PoB_000119200 [Plakobranchus ocellatus]|uniref:Uncharacterized protein n=1 Tax=Plakobranchus ocellatus TaxID=259542 RepID=A0AAV3XW54_9GAST|nr:hypothetical protein PoB_000119200 [Plakobranchus ocellatus]
MDFVPYTAQQLHMYRQHELQQQEKLQQQQQQQHLLQQRQQQSRKFQPQQQFRQKYRFPHQGGQISPLIQRQFFQTHRQFPRPRGLGRLGQHRVVISPVLTDTDSYDFYPAGSVNVRGEPSGFPLNNNDSNNNNNNIKAAADATTSTQLLQACGISAPAGASRQNLTHKGGVQTPEADYDNVVTAVPRLSRVLEEESVLGGGEFEAENTSEDVARVDGIMKDETSRREGKGVDVGKVGVGRGEKNTCSDIASPHAAVPSGDEPDSALLEKSHTGGEREEASRNGLGSDGEGGDGGEQCPRTGDENNVSTDCRCTRSEGISSAQDSREGRVIGDNANGSSGGGGDGGDGGRNNTGEECSSVCHPLNNASEQLEEKTLIVVSGSGSNGTNFQVDKNDKINISRENAAADSVLTVENSCGNSSITTSVNVSNGSESTGEDGENNLISSGNILNLNHPDRIRINSSLDETKINESNGFLAEEEDKTCESESRDSEKEETSVLEMGNQNSASRIGSSSSNSQPQNFNAQSRKDKKGPSSRVDAVHFKKDSSESADSDGGSISIVSEPRKPEDSNCTTEVGGSDTTDVEKQVVLVAAGEEQTSDSKAEPTLVSKTAHSSCSTKEVDETEKFLAPKCHLKEGERMSNGSFSSCSSSSGQYQLCSGPIDQSKCLPEILKSTESVGKVSSSERLSLMSESVEVNLPSVPAVSKTATMIVSTPSTASPHNAAVTTATITAATMAATAATNTAPAVPATTAATVTQLGQVARAIKLGPKTEEIYAVPLPRSMRATSNAQIFPEQEKEQDEDGATSEPPPLPKRLFEGAELTIPASDIESKEIKGESHNVSVSQDTDETLRQMRLQNTVQVTCQMKKSHTACGGLSHVTSSRDSTSDYTGFRGYYYNSSGDGPSYDYFSLGRKPKRQPRIKTLTDSKGMALSLDKLLKLRRQSASTTSTNGSTHLSGEPSVEDIMRTCSEYDMNFSSCNAYRDRTCSDAAATQSPLDLPARTRGPLLSFTQASRITIPDDWEGFGSNTIGGRRHGNVKALVRGAKKHRASARDGKSKNGSGVTVQKSDSVRSAPPASDDRRLEQKPHLQASANDYLPTYTEISRLPTYTEAGVKLAEARSGGLTKKSKLSVSEHHSNPSSASLSSLGSQSSRKSESDKTKNKLCSETHSISSQNSSSKHTADAEPSSLKRDKLSTGSNTLPRASGREHAREASFASSSSSHSSSASTVTIVAADQISQVTESHFISLASPASQSDNTQPASASKLVDSGQIHSSCDNIGSDKDKTAVAPAATVNVVKYGPISSSSIAIKPASGSRPKNGMDLSPPRNISASNSQHTAELNKSKDSNRTQSTSSSSSKYKFPLQGKSSVSTDSGSSMDGTTGGSYSGSLKRKQDKVESKKSSDKKTYTLKWLKPTDKGSKNKTQKDTSFRKAMSADQGQTRVSATSDQDSRSSSLTTSGSFTSDPRSPLTSGGSLDDHRSPVFSPLSPAGSAEMSCLTVDTSSSFSHSKERGRISPLFAAPRSPNHSSSEAMAPVAGSNRDRKIPLDLIADFATHSATNA